MSHLVGAARVSCSNPPDALDSDLLALGWTIGYPLSVMLMVEPCPLSVADLTVQTWVEPYALHLISGKFKH